MARVTLPFACVFIAFLLIYLPKAPLSVAMAKEGKGYDNANPRAQQERLTGWGARARAAHANAFEAFPPFAAAVVVAHLAHADAKWMTILAVTHVAARALYPFIYMANLATLRSAVWTIGFGATAGLFVLPWIA
jgi:uncharacterized MAPEG superfamily protein